VVGPLGFRPDHPGQERARALASGSSGGLSVESYFPLSAADRFVVGIAAALELSFGTGVPLLAFPVWLIQTIP
jgi:hypothetical protein